MSSAVENSTFASSSPTGGTTTAPSPQLLTVTEVAGMFRVSKMTVYRMMHSGELAHVKVGRTFRVPADAVHTIMNGTERLSA
jgi:excisionase family DNA binding protein